MISCLCTLAFGLSVVLTRALVGFLLKRNLIDEPDGSRKLHERAVPRLGGVAVLLAFVAAAAAGALAFPLFGWEGRAGLLLQLAPACAIIFLLGVIDDLSPVRPGHKLAIQVFASLAAVIMGIHFGSGGLSLVGVLQGLLTTAWLVLCTNAFNLIDGIDGLATGLGIILSATIALVGYLLSQPGLVFVGLVLTACLLGFLCHNFHPASIFLGDSGSLTIGFLLGCLSVLWSNQETTVTGKIAPAVAFAVPFADVAVSIVRRFFSGRRILSPDRDHIHYRLLRIGFDPRSTALLLYTIAAFSSLMALSCAMFSPIVGIVGVVAVCFLLLLCLRQLHYPELHAFRLALTNFSPLALIVSRLVLRNFQGAIKKASGRLDIWTALQRACCDFGFDHVRLTWGGRLYEWSDIVCSTDSNPPLLLSISEVDSLVLRGSPANRRNRDTVAAFISIALLELKTHTAESQTNNGVVALPYPNPCP